MNINIDMQIFSIYIYFMCVYLYIHNKCTQHTHILCKQKLSFWMRLITINRLTALLLTNMNKR